MKKCCLIVIFNHRYDKNIPKIKELYCNRFDDIYVIMPFYNGEEIPGITIIPVYESSYYFSGYISQAFEMIKKVQRYNHYVIIGDDLVLNPLLDQNNICEALKLNSEASYLKGIRPLQLSEGISSKRLFQEVAGPFIDYNGTEWRNEIPSCTEAVNLVGGYDLSLSKKWLLSQIGTGKPNLARTMGRIFYLLKVIAKFKGKLPYPFYKIYSDFLVLSDEDMDNLCHLFGVFAAMGVFIEVAIPTAMKIACKKIVTEDMISLHGVEYWTAEDNKKIEQRYCLNLKKLLDEWDESVLYYHPIKLSKWE